MADDSLTTVAALRYRRMRVPREHGATLQIPPLNQLESGWSANRSRIQQQRSQSLHLWPTGDQPLDNLADLRQLARRQLVAAAAQYTSDYLDTSPISAADLQPASERIVMSGHQPQLFHPGVWYKNFVLHQLGHQFRATAINLVVDSDLSGDENLRFPQWSETRYRLGTLDVDRAAPALPYERRPIVDWEYFRQFPDRVDAALGRQPDRIVHRLWEQVQFAARPSGDDRTPNLGMAIAAGRHRLEFENGLRTLEVPVSWVARTTSFAMFAGSILLDLPRFHRIYNLVIADYRKINHVRSQSHPVPQLTTDGDWFESPFWVWTTDDPGRKPLMVRQLESTIQLRGGDRHLARLGPADFVSKFSSLQASGIAIRPRALTTTMYSRLLASDLFLHGIGGAKYDQLTDAIAKSFYSVTLPDYVTLSATFQLPHDFPVVTKDEVTALDVQRRDMNFHPERFLETPDHQAADWIRQKREWLTGAQRLNRSREKHLAVEQLNHQLRTRISPSDDEIRQQRDRWRKRLRDSQIVASREYSYCLFDSSLIDQLQAAARPVEPGTDG